MASSIDASTSGAGGVITTADNTGILQLKTAGTTAVTVDASQNVGIGTTSPSTKLEVNGSGYFYSGVNVSNGSPIQSKDSSGTLYNMLYMYSDNNVYVSSPVSGSSLIFRGAGYAERMRIDSSGNLLIGVSSGSSSSCKLRVQGGADAQGSSLFLMSSTASYNFEWYVAAGTGYNAAATAQIIPKNSSTNRSINAAGSLNASGADYAEYMTKASNFTLAKGDVVGIDANGKLTNVFTDAISFCVKSTDPSYVGGDTWGNEEAIGKKPEDEDLLSEWEAKLETARQLVDRIAFAGQVPVNVLGATSGQYIIPINDNGSIKGEAVSNPTFEQYKIAVGKVIAIEADGRARIIVKVA